MLRPIYFLRYVHHFPPGVAYLLLVVSTAAMLRTRTALTGASAVVLDACMATRTGLTHIRSMTDIFKGMSSLFTMGATAAILHTWTAWSGRCVGTGDFRSAVHIWTMAKLATPLKGWSVVSAKISSRFRCRAHTAKSLT